MAEAGQLLALESGSFPLGKVLACVCWRGGGGVNASLRGALNVYLRVGAIYVTYLLLLRPKLLRTRLTMSV